MARALRSTDRRLKHGHWSRQTPEYVAWLSMNCRCYSPAHPGWSIVGGLGIKVCKRWRGDFETFLADVGRRPSPRHMLNRIDKKKHYTPSNTRWALRRDVGRTRRANDFHTVGHVTLCLEDWARRAGIGKSTLHYRLAKGLTMREAIDRGHGGQGRVLA